MRSTRLTFLVLAVLLLLISSSLSRPIPGQDPTNSILDQLDRITETVTEVKHNQEKQEEDIRILQKDQNEQTQNINTLEDQLHTLKEYLKGLPSWFSEAK